MDEIPPQAICHKCGKPMRVIDLSAQAARLGVQVPADSFVIECCGANLIVEDVDVARALRDLLLAYHKKPPEE